MSTAGERPPAPGEPLSSVCDAECLADRRNVQRITSFHVSLANSHTTPRKGFPLSLTISLLPGILICLIGFLAWGIPFSQLQGAMYPLAKAVRMELMDAMAEELQFFWDCLHGQVLEQQMSWLVADQPVDAFQEANKLLPALYPGLICQRGVVSLSVATFHGSCIHVTALHLLSKTDFMLERQNCTHRWLQKWDVLAQIANNQAGWALPLVSKSSIEVGGVITATSKTQPFSWLGIAGTDTGVGDVLGAACGLFNRINGSLAGAFIVQKSLSSLNRYIGQALRGQSATSGGRMVIFDKYGYIVASTHGLAFTNTTLFDIGDPDLQQAAQYMWKTFGSLCVPINVQVTFSKEYFLDVVIVIDNHTSVQSLEWCLLLLSPCDDSLAVVKQSLNFAIIFVCCITCGVTLLCLVLGLVVTRPLRELASGMASLKRYNMTPVRPSHRRRSVFAELCEAQASLDSLVGAMEAFGKYVPYNVVRGLLANVVPPHLGMDEKTVAVAFMDIQNFTAMCELVEAREIVQVSCRLFDVCCDLIHQSQGTVDKFIGDCIMVLWGAPASLIQPGKHALQACSAILKFLNKKPLALRNGTRLGVRIGLSSGHCLVGNFGASSRWDYTVVGEIVNVASRLESLNKQFHTQCLAPCNVTAQLPGHDSLHQYLRSMGQVLVQGKAEPIPIFEVMTSPSEDLDQWSDAIDLLNQGRFDEGLKYFCSLPYDDVVDAIIKDAAHAQASGVKGAWVRTMVTK